MAYSRKISDGQFFSGCDMARRRSTTPPPSSSGFACRSSAPVLLPDSFATNKTTATFQSRPSTTTTSSYKFSTLASSPTRLRAYGGFSKGRISGNNSYSRNHPSSLSGSRANVSAMLNQKRTTSCDCSTQNHPLAYRCPLHRRESISQTAQNLSKSTRLNCRRSAMANSLVSLGVEGELVKRSLSKLVRPSSNLDELLRLRVHFRPKPSRLSASTKAEDP